MNGQACIFQNRLTMRLKRRLLTNRVHVRVAFAEADISTSSSLHSWLTAAACVSCDIGQNERVCATLTLGATRAGVILGTAGYMSPEQAHGKTADRRADRLSV